VESGDLSVLTKRAAVIGGLICFDHASVAQTQRFQICAVHALASFLTM
jgi:hypothetical protein